MDQFLYKRIALIGAIANPNVGDDAILDAQLTNIEKMFGDDYKAYVFSKDASYTIRFTQTKRGEVLPIDYIHRITLESLYSGDALVEKSEELLSYDNSVRNNSLFSNIHSIFQEIDVLHVIGGGYINSLWPDMAIEIYMAVKLAKKYGKKVVITGISTTPVLERDQWLFLEIMGAADVIDYRDDSYKLLGYEEAGKLSRTVDDAVLYTSPRRSGFGTEGRYANFTMMEWEDHSEVIREKITGEIVPFISRLLKEKELDYVNILSFSDGDFHCWEDAGFPEDVKSGVRFLDLSNHYPYEAKEIVESAVFNAGMRYHHAVFSLSSQVPIFSIYSEEYYHNKIESVHSSFHSDSWCDINDVTTEILAVFYNNIGAIQRKLTGAWDDVRELIKRKNWVMAVAYGEDEKETEVLFNRLNGDLCKVSVIIPIYNMGDYLQECLDSVLSQTLKEIEVVCINDGSTDRSQDILYDNAWRDKRVRVFTQENSGVAAARNKGLKEAKGEYVFFIDPDDWLFDDKVLSDLYNAAKNNKAAIAGGGFAECNPRFPAPFTDWSGNACKYVFDQERFYTFEELQFEYGWIRFMYNRNFLISHNFTFPKRVFYEDPVWFVQVMHEAGTFYGMTRTVYCYRTGHKVNNFSQKKTVDLLKGIGDIIEFSIKHHYPDLLDLEKTRLTRDYALYIANHIEKNPDPEVCRELDRINGMLYPNGNQRVEYAILNYYREWEKGNPQNTAARVERVITKIDHKLTNTIDRYHAFSYSMNRKAGDMVHSLPGRVKKGVSQVRSRLRP